jgi:hypothetical protein
MKRSGLSIFLLLPALLLWATGLIGSHRDPDAESATVSRGAANQKLLEPLASAGWGTLEGRITYDGDALPENAPLNITKDLNVCLCEEAKKRGDHLNQVWLGNKTNGGIGVANVVIFLKPPAGKYFTIHEAYKDVSESKTLGKVVLDQPFCAYEPRVVVLYPSYTITGKKQGKDVNQQVSSNQVFEVRNSAKVPHNTKIKGNGLDNGTQDSGVMAPGSKARFELSPQDQPLYISCDIHPWQRAYAWAFDHPYAARTDKDGKFKIEHVPAGAEVNVVIWHEGLQATHYFTGDGFAGPQGKKMTFDKSKTTTLNLKIKA